jgi:ABC-2 type transport system ATP-binding protein
MIHVDHLTKRYGRRNAVDGASFDCAPGTVTGFLGPNGAGKSTTLRVLTGLSRPDSGTATIDGRPYAAHPNPGRLVGVLLDASAQHPGRTGAETLRLAARLLGMPARAADDMLDRVGLGADGGRRVGAYSLGMRQRLGIGTALLGDPAVLVLDEPANGMDPQGIRWMRQMLQDFAAGGGTVLLSSHLLAEVQATVDRLVVISHGRVVAEGTLDVLLAPRGTSVRGIDGPALAAALRRAGLQVHTQPDGELLVDAPPDDVSRAALAAGQVLVELRPAGGAGVEDLFFELTA